MSNIIKGSNVVFAVRFTEGTLQTLRVLNQTGGSRSKSRDEIELNSKDVNGTEYGRKTETISFEGLLTDGDVAFDNLEACIDNATYAEILEINIDTRAAKAGKYMISALEKDYSNDESATYSFDAKLSGDITEEVLLVVPAGDTLATP